MIKTILLVFTMVAYLASALAQRAVVHGKIVDPFGTAVPGASILVKGTAAGTRTDSMGNFSLSLSPDAMVIISAIGFSDTSFAVAGRKELAITLYRQTSELNAARVQGQSAANSTKLGAEVVNQQIAGNTINNFREAQNLSSGQTISEGLVQN